MKISASSVVVATALCLGLVAAGTTVAVAASHSRTVKVCVTKKDVVRSANSHGACPRKTKKKAVSVQGPRGATGATGVAGVHVVKASRTAGFYNSQDYYDSDFFEVTCPTGEKALSGGYESHTSSTKVVYFSNGPNDTGNGWKVYVHNDSGFPANVDVYAVCART